MTCHDERSEPSAFVRIRALLSDALHLLVAVLREIFDEAAYDRYLRQTGSTPSRKSFAEFITASNAKKERRPRCC
jgi:hypothetical protein